MKTRRTTQEKIALFKACFAGRLDVYGTYDIRTGKARQAKEPVTDSVIHAHLAGRKPYGVYLLDKDKTRAVAEDVDTDDANPTLEFLKAAEHYGISAYIERSKSKGYHVWVFFDWPVPAWKPRLVVKEILEEIGQPNTEVFPKHDALEDGMYGNFINAPWFGKLVPERRTVFLDPDNGLKPFTNQWDFLESIQRLSEQALDEIIEVNDWAKDREVKPVSDTSPDSLTRTFGLPPCARRMLEEGVREYQRVACFRLAVAMKKAGVPLDAAIAALNVWALKNRPANGKAIIMRREIMAQAASAYKRRYRSCGCNHPAVKPFYDPTCTVCGKAATTGTADKLLDQ